jgi:hypothetical protein
VFSKYILNNSSINEIENAGLTDALLAATSENLYKKFGCPKLFLSITGEELNFPLEEDIKNTLKFGLQKAAKTTSNTWIITDGADVGKVQIVGQSVANEGLTVIGIPSYNQIEHFMKLQVQ